MTSFHLKPSRHHTAQNVDENGKHDILLTGHNKSLVRPNCVDVPHSRSLVLALKTIGPHNPSQSQVKCATSRHNLSIALSQLVHSDLSLSHSCLSPPPLTD